jgi:hypothetical protein
MTAPIVEAPGPRTRSARHPRLWWVIAGAVVLVGALVVAAGIAYYRIDLFNEYQAGYASVEPQQNLDGGLRSVPCNRALDLAYGVRGIGQNSSGQEFAFFQGCMERLWGMPSNPWDLHTSLRSDD